MNVIIIIIVILDYYNSGGFNEFGIRWQTLFNKVVTLQGLYWAPLP